MAVFSKGDEVEVCSKKEGLVGPFLEATVISQLKDEYNNSVYKVQYKKRVEKEDETRPLVEMVSDEEVRPLPPRETTGIFHHLQRVDAFENDGWWVWNIRGTQGLTCLVYFDALLKRLRTLYLS